MTEKELTDMLRRNPDLSVDGGMDVQTANAPVWDVHHIASEHDLQAAIIAECDRRTIVNPAWGMVAAIPNGQYRKGQRAEPGLRAGLPDLIVLLPRRGYGAAFVELKRTPNKPNELQWEWIGRLQENGYYAAVIWDSVDEAIRLLEWYIEGRDYP